MPENHESPAAGNGESFADLLDSYTEGIGDSLSVGDKVRGTIISISEESVFIDTGAKIDGVCERAELVEKEGEFPYKEGDEIELYVVSINASEVRLSRALSGVGGAAMLREAFENRLPVEGKVTQTVKGGFSVEVMHRRAFCPVSQIDNKFVEDPEEYVGRTLEFLVIKFEQNGRNVVLSRREILEREKRESMEKFMAEVEAGSIVEGTVSRLQPFGAFVEIFPGIEGLCHVSELSWSRVAQPDEAVSPGDKVRAKVLSIEPGKKEGQLRISLSVKQVTDDPWNSAEGRFKEGDKLTGKVIRCADFGAFVEIAPGIEGLVHISEMSYTKRVHRPDEMVAPGDSISVVVKEFDATRRRVSLSMRDAEGDPWATVADNYKSGQAVEGTVEKRERFGWFIQLEPGITALLPKSLADRSEKKSDFDKLVAGDKVSLVVESVSPRERRMSLAPADARDTEDTGDWKKYAAPSKPKASSGTTSGESLGSLGSLGDALKAAIDKKKS